MSLFQDIGPIGHNMGSLPSDKSASRLMQGLEGLYQDCAFE